MVYTGRADVHKMLLEWRFLRQGRIWLNERLGIVLDFVRPPYTGDLARTQALETPYDSIRLAALEDSIVKRLASAKHCGGLTTRTRPSSWLRNMKTGFSGLRGASGGGIRCRGSPRLSPAVACRPAPGIALYADCLGYLQPRTYVPEDKIEAFDEILRRYGAKRHIIPIRSQRP